MHERMDEGMDESMYEAIDEEMNEEIEVPDDNLSEVDELSNDEAADPFYDRTQRKKQEKNTTKVISGAKLRDLLKTLELIKEKSEILCIFFDDKC